MQMLTWGQALKGQAHNFAPGYNGTEYSIVEVTKAETGSRDGTHF